tara:strand:+ start:438 stop:572 length:135 start_codon:yes stop_codon:yes gene_type:complete
MTLPNQTDFLPFGLNTRFGKIIVYGVAAKIVIGAAFLFYTFSIK